MFSWWSEPTPQEKIKIAERNITLTKRQLERDIKKLKSNQNKAFSDTKKAKKNSESVQIVRAHAITYVTYKRTIEHITLQMANMDTIQAKFAITKSTAALGAAFKQLAATMRFAASLANAPSIIKSANEIAYYEDKLSVSEEMIFNAMSNDESGLDDEADAVLAEIGDYEHEELKDRFPDVKNNTGFHMKSKQHEL